MQQVQHQDAEGARMTWQKFIDLLIILSFAVGCAMIVYGCGK